MFQRDKAPTPRLLTVRKETHDMFGSKSRVLKLIGCQ